MCNGCVQMPLDLVFLALKYLSIWWCEDSDYFSSSLAPKGSSHLAHPSYINDALFPKSSDRLNA